MENSCVAMGTVPSIAGPTETCERSQGLMSYLLSNNSVVEEAGWDIDDNTGKMIMRTFDYYGVTSRGEADVCGCTEVDCTGCPHEFTVGEVCVKYCVTDLEMKKFRTACDINIKELSGTRAMAKQRAAQREYIQKLSNAIHNGLPGTPTASTPDGSSFLSIFDPAYGVDVYDANLSVNIEQFLYVAKKRNEAKTGCQTSGTYYTRPEIVEYLRRKACSADGCSDISVVGNSVYYMGDLVLGSAGFLASTDAATGKLTTSIMYAPNGSLGVKTFTPINSPELVNKSLEAIQRDEDLTVDDCGRYCFKIKNKVGMVAKDLHKFFVIDNVTIPFGVSIYDGIDPNWDLPGVQA